jgi:hypothetical protein
MVSMQIDKIPLMTERHRPTSCEIVHPNTGNRKTRAATAYRGWRLSSIHQISIRTFGKSQLK